jgi:hypothetical protein
MNPNADMLPFAVVMLSIVLAVHLVWHDMREGKK